tara:strand:+ start:120 stop:350 length:231 start_codon:yes stop_codon:yes gene_type:complete
MNCWHCNEEVEWEEDIDLPDPDWEFVTKLRCSVCEAYYQIFLPRGGEYEYVYEDPAPILSLVPTLEKKAPDEEPGE